MQRILCTSMCLVVACGFGVVGTAAKTEPGEGQQAAGHEEVRKSDLAKMQGQWELSLRDANGNPLRSVKEINGTTTFLTRYNQQGEIIDAHTSELELTITDQVKIHTWRNLEVTAGPGKGTKHPGPAAFIYVIDDNSWREVWGLLRGDVRPPAMFVWKRLGSAN